jgi:uncharacterized membrane protein
MTVSDPSTTRQPEDQPQGAAPQLVKLLHRIEGMSALDPVMDAVTPVSDLLLSSSRVRHILRGTWMGHALHPPLTDVPIGTWTSASLLDLVGGARSRPAAEVLLATGIVAAVPTAAAGVAEWQTTSGGDRRVGFVHAMLNVTALTLYGSSVLARRRGNHASGVALGLAGLAVATASGYLGGHLAIARKIGTADAALAS